MNKKQAVNYAGLIDALGKHGITRDEVDILLRCERALQRWAERECGDGSNWGIERDETTGKPFNVYHGPGDSRRYPIYDRETGAYNWALAIGKAHRLTAYHQGDCRGCMLYMLRPGDVPKGEQAGAYYTRGVAICID